MRCESTLQEPSDECPKDNVRSYLLSVTARGREPQVSSAAAEDLEVHDAVCPTASPHACLWHCPPSRPAHDELLHSLKAHRERPVRLAGAPDSGEPDGQSPSPSHIDAAYPIMPLHHKNIGLHIVLRNASQPAFGTGIESQPGSGWAIIPFASAATRTRFPAKQGRTPVRRERRWRSRRCQ